MTVVRDECLTHIFMLLQNHRLSELFHLNHVHVYRDMDGESDKVKPVAQLT
jgi:hypothetical protein